MDPRVTEFLHLLGRLLQVSGPMMKLWDLAARETGTEEDLAGVRQRIEEGATILEAVSESPGLFPPLACGLIGLGEERGWLEATLPLVPGEAPDRVAGRLPLWFDLLALRFDPADALDAISRGALDRPLAEAAVKKLRASVPFGEAAGPLLPFDLEVLFDPKYGVAPGEKVARLLARYLRESESWKGGEVRTALFFLRVTLVAGIGFRAGNELGARRTRDRGLQAFFEEVNRGGGPLCAGMKLHPDLFHPGVVHLVEDAEMHGDLAAAIETAEQAMDRGYFVPA